MILRSFRLVYIMWVSLKFGLYDLINLKGNKISQFFAIFFAKFSRTSDLPMEERFRLALETLGPTFIKLGQVLSTRRDLLPESYANELAKLQDNVPGFNAKIAIDIIERAYKKKIHTLFKFFDKTPMAAASIAQVHAAELFDGSQVVVKLVRPNIEKTIKRDIELMYILAGLMNKFWEDAKRMRLNEVIAEYEKAILSELDLISEANNALLLKSNFKDSSLLYIPKIETSLITKNVLVMERITGISIGQIETLKALNVNIPLLAERSVEIFFTQVFKHSFFHADMHPGNIFVNVTDPQNPTHIALDFGVMGFLNTKDQRYLADNFMAFFNRDYHKVATLHIESGWIPSDTPVHEFEMAIRLLCEPIFNKPLKDISFGHFLVSLFAVTRRFKMEVQPQLLLLQKTLLAVEGLGRQLYPELDLWKTAKPFLTKFVMERSGYKAVFNRYSKDIPTWIETFPETVKNTNLVFNKLLEHEIHTQLSNKTMDEIKTLVSKEQKKFALAQYGSVILLLSGASIIYTSANFWNISGLLLALMIFVSVHTR